MSKIIVDMMGSDLGCKATLEGVTLFKQKHPDCELVLVGKKEEIGEGTGCRIIEANDIVPMNAGALQVIRMKESSMYKAIQAVNEEKADGVVSAGGTGAFLSGCALILKKIPGITRPALVTQFPTLIEGKKTVLLDCGASTENTPEELVSFGLMGKLYAEAICGAKDPEVYLVANGTEEGKGSVVGKEAYKLMKETKLYNFKGNIESKEVLNGTADVLVTDGFTGNVLLKTVEGVAKFMGKNLKKIYKSNLKTKIGYLCVKKEMGGFLKMMDPKQTGGALLCGVNGVAVKAHGNSDGFAFFRALVLAYELIKANVVEEIKKGVNPGE